MKKIIILIIFILFNLFSFTTNVDGNTKTKKLFLIKKINKNLSKILCLEIPSCEYKAEASYYNPKDSRQTKKEADGIGAFGRRIESGSIALGSIWTKYFIDNRLIIFVYIKIEGLDVETPYGKNIFRVDDQMNKRYRTDDKYFIDFNPNDLDKRYKELGRFNVRFKFCKIMKKSRLKT